MRGPLLDILDRLMEESAGWLILLCGVLLLAGAVLVPAWQANRHLVARRDVMARQLEQMNAQRQRYSEFDTALEADDPLLLERLAYSQLHWRPAEAQTWRGKAEQVQTAGNLTALSEDHLAASSSVDAVLTEPGRDLDQLAQTVETPGAPTRLERLTSGFSRWVLLAAGVLLMLGGLGMEGKTA